jgi:superfamily II DNA or RNA helicase
MKSDGEIIEILKREGIYKETYYKYYKKNLEKYKKIVRLTIKDDEDNKNKMLYEKMIKRIIELEKGENTKIEWRINQKQAFEIVEKEIKNGIHCQATGCGKSYIILKYCAEYGKRYKKNIMIFTERINILNDLFSLDNKIEQEKLFTLWRENKLIDMNNFNIIDKINDKNKKWLDELDENKINIIVINRAFISVCKETYKKITKEKIGLILHDECHNAVSYECFNFLNEMKKKDIIIVGFSATPLRTGKTKGINNKERLIEIYGEDNKLNILTNYNMIYAIQNNLILPPKFIWYSLSKVYAREYKINEDLESKENEEKYEKENKNIKIEEVDYYSVLKILIQIKKDSKYNKIIAWCGTISNTNKWYKKFIKMKEENNNEYFKDLKIYKDHSKIKEEENNYNKFKEQENNSIMFCANKHREGSDIKNLEICIFIDGVINRSPIPFIQSIGRVLRLDKNQEKKNGFVIDCIIKDRTNEYEKEICNKIIGYYISLENINIEENDGMTKYDRYKNMMERINFDVSTSKITINFNDKDKLDIKVEDIEWKNISDKFDEIIRNRIKISAEEKLRSVKEILKEKFNFNEKTDFNEEYKKISDDDKIKYKLPDITTDEFIKVFNEKTWFEILDIKHNYYNYYELEKRLYKTEKTDINNNWHLLCSYDEKIPINPYYVYIGFNKLLLGNKTKKKE